MSFDSSPNCPPKSTAIEGFCRGTASAFHQHRGTRKLAKGSQHRASEQESGKPTNPSSESPLYTSGICSSSSKPGQITLSCRASRPRGAVKPPRVLWRKRLYPAGTASSLRTDTRCVAGKEMQSNSPSEQSQGSWLRQLPRRGTRPRALGSDNLLQINVFHV